MLVIKGIFTMVLLSATAVDSLAFNVFSAFQANPSLSKLAEAQMGEKFTVKMDIGQKDETHLLLDGLCVELLKETAPANQNIGLPGASGPHPRLSTGALALQVISMPSFIDMFGTQKVRFEKGCWEMVWKKDQHCGSIICGFEVPNGAKRNGANLPAGRLYLSFPVWTQGGLSVRQEERTHAEAKVKEFSQEKDDELRKMEATSNLFMKAVHYRNAVAAVEKIDMSGIRFLSQIPLENEVMPIGDGILMNTKGTIWNKDNNFLGAKHSLLGEAILSPYVEDQIQTDVLKP